MPEESQAPESIDDKPAQGGSDSEAAADETAPDETAEQPVETYRQRLLGWAVGLAGVGIPMVLVIFLIYRHTVTEAYVFTEPKELVSSVAFSPDGKLVAAGGVDKTIRVWDVQSKKLFATLKGHRQAVNSIAFSPDGSRLVSGDFLNARLWDVQSGEEILSLNSPTNFIMNVTLSPDGNYVTTTSTADPFIRLWNVKQKIAAEFPASLAGMLAASPAIGPLPAAASLHPSRTSLGLPAGIFRGHVEPVNNVVFFKDGQRLLSAGDRTVRLWDVATGKLLDTFEGPKAGVRWVALAPDEKSFAFADNNQMIHVWSLTDKKEEMLLKGHKSAIVCLDYSPDGRHLVSGSLGSYRSVQEKDSAMPVEARTIRIWSLATGAEGYYLENVSEAVFSVKFSPDGNYLVSGGADKKVHLWSVP